MKEENVDYFKKIPPSEKKILFKEISASRVILNIKPDEQDEMLSFVVMKTDEKKLLLKVLPGSSNFEKRQTAFVSFQLREDRYFFQAEGESFGSSNEGCVLILTTEVFILQRRKTLRVKIPPEYPGFFNLIRRNDKVIIAEGNVLDFSSGGLKVFLKTVGAVIEVGDLVRGVLHLGHRRPFELDAQIRHILQRPQGGIIYGIQFKNMTNILENRMMILNMDLHREIFNKYSSKY